MSINLFTGGGEAHVPQCICRVREQPKEIVFLLLGIEFDWQIWQSFGQPTIDYFLQLDFTIADNKEVEQRHGL